MESKRSVWCIWDWLSICAQGARHLSSKLAILSSNAHSLSCSKYPLWKSIVRTPLVLLQGIHPSTTFIGGEKEELFEALNIISPVVKFWMAVKMALKPLTPTRVSKSLSRVSAWNLNKRSQCLRCELQHGSFAHGHWHLIRAELGGERQFCFLTYKGLRISMSFIHIYCVLSLLFV